MIYTETGASDFLLACLNALPNGSTLLEVGSLRNSTEPARWSDGWGTLTLAEWAKEHDGNVVTIDVRNRTQPLKQVLGDKMEWVTHEVGDAMGCIGRRSDTYGLAYLDGPNDAAMHLQIVQAITDRTQRIAFDDAEVKAVDALPWLASQGWHEILHDGRHTCWSRP